MSHVPSNYIDVKCYILVPECHTSRVMYSCQDICANTTAVTRSNDCHPEGFGAGPNSCSWGPSIQSGSLALWLALWYTLDQNLGFLNGLRLGLRY